MNTNEALNKLEAINKRLISTQERIFTIKLKIDTEIQNKQSKSKLYRELMELESNEANIITEAVKTARILITVS
jgi:hypothetical protein